MLQRRIPVGINASILQSLAWVVSLWHSVYENFLDKNLTYGICGIQFYHLIFSKFMVVAKLSNIDFGYIVYVGI